jgi:hypothetical protein
VSPIFVRPVREQLEHDRLIRFLQGKYSKKKLEAAVNVGEDRAVPVKIGVGLFYPDLVLTSGKKLMGVVEVETGESVNNLEALAQWTHFSRARVPFHLYVPVSGYDAARRLCAANDAHPAEIWTYRGTNEGFDLVRIFQDSGAAAARPPAAVEPAGAARRGAAAEKKTAARTAGPAKKPKPAPKAKRPAARGKPAPKARKNKKR